MNQTDALSLLKTGVNVFLTGEPGSGKSYLVNKYIEYLKEHNIAVSITASTGIAATHLNGVTIHSWSGIGIKKTLTNSDLTALRKKKWLVNRVQKTSVLIIDEISMLDAQTLDTVNKSLQSIRNSKLPFGGLQIVFVGDFFQLPPVNQEGGEVSFAFEAEAWSEANPYVCYLSEQHRQSEPIFSEFLRDLRLAEKSPVQLATFLKQNTSKKLAGNFTRLYTHNMDVDTVNQEKLDSILGVESIYKQSSTGADVLVHILTKSCLSPAQLTLKKNAEVMFTKNNYEAGYVNGTLGTVVDYKDGLPLVQTKSGRMIRVEKADWSIEDNGKKIATISQLPLRLAWAITVHKSQGMTLDAASMDLSRSFEYGQGYVAISRTRSLAGLFLLGLNERAMEVHPKILNQDLIFKQLSFEAEKNIQSSFHSLAERIKTFIFTAGGSFKKTNGSSTQSSKESTHEKTLRLYKAGYSIAEIAQTRGIQERTIISHLEKLKANKSLTSQELKTVVSRDLRKNVPQISKAFLEENDGKLTPVFQKFKGKYSFEELQLVRLSM